MDQLLENAIKGKYNGAPAKYVSLYSDLMDAGIPYCEVAGMQMALFKGELMQHIIKYIHAGTRP